MKNKFIYTLSALLMACIIAFSGLGGSYIQAQATSVGIKDTAWNSDASAWENILNYLNLFMAYQGVYINPVGSFLSAQNCYDFMIEDGVSHDVAHGVFCDCDDSTHTSFTGQEHGGGGFVRDGITPTDDGGVTISDEISDLFHDYVQDCLDSNSGYVLMKTVKASDIASYMFDTEIESDNFIQTVNNLGMFWYRENNGCHIPTNNLYNSSAKDMYLNFYYDDEGESYYKMTVDGSDPLNFYVLEDDWSYHYPYFYTTVEGSTSSRDWKLDYYEKSYGLNDLYLSSSNSSNAYLLYVNFDKYGEFSSFRGLVSNDGRNVKVWYSLDAFKNFDIGNQSFYITNNWINYGGTVNNTTVITGGEVEIYNNTNIYQTIQDDIDNYDGELTEEVVNTIVNDAVNRITDKMEDIQEEGSVVIPNEDTKTFYDKVLDYLDKILKQLKQIKWLNVADLVDDIIANLMEWKSEFEPVVETIMTKFPFSIPWDTMLIFGLLADEPETPRFEFPFVLERFGINEVIVIDLEQFTTLSKISRFLLTLTFLLMLTALTRKISEWFHSSN